MSKKAQLTRRRAGATPTAVPTFDAESNRPAMRAYRLSIIGLIPLAGLVLGPIALVLGILAARKGRDDPGFTAHGPARGAILFGAVDAVANWAGVTLMVIGLWSLFAR
jgi:hypothetical protein